MPKYKIGLSENDREEMKLEIIRRINDIVLKRQIVDSLPETDIDPNIIYMVRNENYASYDNFNEYMYINNNWELIGSTFINIDDFYNKEEIDSKLEEKMQINGKNDGSGKTLEYLNTDKEVKFMAKRSRMYGMGANQPQGDYKPHQGLVLDLQEKSLEVATIKDDDVKDKKLISMTKDKFDVNVGGARLKISGVEENHIDTNSKNLIVDTGEADLELNTNDTNLNSTKSVNIVAPKVNINTDIDITLNASDVNVNARLDTKNQIVNETARTKIKIGGTNDVDYDFLIEDKIHNDILKVADKKVLIGANNEEVATKTYIDGLFDGKLEKNENFITKTTPQEVKNESQAKINYIGGNSEVSENLIVLEDKKPTTINGITYSIKDGVITLNGTNTHSEVLYLGFRAIGYTKLVLNGDFKISSFTNDTNIRYRQLYSLNGTTKYDLQIPTGAIYSQTISISNGLLYTSEIIIPQNYTCNNIKIKPMLVKGSTAPTEFKQGFLGIRNATPNKLVSYGANLLNYKEASAYDSNFINLEKGKKYYFKCFSDESYNGIVIRKGGKYLKEYSNKQGYFVLESDTDNDYQISMYKVGTSPKNYILANDENSKLYLGETKVTEFKPYVEPTSIDIPLYSELLSVGNVRDKYYPNGNLVRNVGVRDYVVGDENNSNYLTDMTTTYYPLATPILSQAQVWQDSIKVYKGGTETFEGTDVPIYASEEYVLETHFEDLSVLSRVINKKAKEKNKSVEELITAICDLV